MTPFESEILIKAIELFIKTGRPVSSWRMKKSYGLSVSTANIRSMLHNMEERGYLFKPHVSSGRVPTDLGYRYYVNELKTLGGLSRSTVAEIKMRIGRDWREVRDVMSVTSRLLSEMTSYMGLVIGIVSASCTVEKLEIVQMEGSRALIVLHLSPERKRNSFVDFPKRYPTHIIDRAVQIINERISGHSLEAAPEVLDDFLRESAGCERDIAEAISAGAEQLFDWAYDLEYHFRGVPELFDNKELNNPRLLQNLVRIMGEKSLMLKVLKTRMQQELMVTIGRENNIDELADFSIVTQKFYAGDCEGLLGVLGPTRMSYRLVLSLLHNMTSELHQLDLES
jgi:heat-inducible transcriptional repressor